MRPDETDAGFLWDMLDAAKTVREFTEKLRYDEYVRDRMRQLAVERAVEIIGEAARKVSKEFKDAHPEIPWSKIVAQRHILAHEYGEVRQDRISAVASVHVPDLIRMLEPLVPRPETDPEAERG